MDRLRDVERLGRITEEDDREAVIRVEHDALVRGSTAAVACLARASSLLLERGLLGYRARVELRDAQERDVGVDGRRRCACSAEL